MELIAINGWMTAAAALGATALPVALHLLIRRKPKRVAFPGLRLLRSKRAKITRRLRLQQLLLLALRCALLLLLGLALARPRLSGSPNAGDAAGPVAAVVVIDNSPSMALVHQGRTRLQAAVELARARILQLAEGSRIYVVESAQPASHQPFDPPAALARLNTIDLQPAQNRLNEAVAVAFRILARSDLPRGEIDIFTDRAAHAWNPAETARLEAARKAVGADRPFAIHVLDVGVEQPVNQSLVSVRATETQLAAGAEWAISGRAENRGPAIDATVTLLVDGAERGQKAIRLEPDGGVDVTLPGPPLPVGPHAVTLRLSGGDTVRLDNERHLSVEVRDPPEVLVIAGAADEADNWVNALDPAPLRGKQQPRFRVEAVTGAGQLLKRDLNAPAALCLLNLPPPPPEAWKRLAERLAAGRGLFVALGDRTTAEGYNTPAAQAVLPALLGPRQEPKGDVTVAAEARGQDPVNRAFAELGRNDLALGYVDAYLRCKPSEGAAVLLRYTNGDAALIDRKVGEGRCVLLTTAAHYKPKGSWSELPLTWSYVVLAEQVVRHVAGLDERTLNFPVGASTRLELPPGANVAQVSVTDPAKEVQRIGVADPAARAVPLPPMKLAGHYVAEAGDQGKVAKGLFAANVPDAESRLEPIDKEALAKLLGAEHTAIASDLESLARAAEAGMGAIDLHPALMLLLLLAISIEGMVAHRFYPPPPDPAVAGAAGSGGGAGQATGPASS